MKKIYLSIFACVCALTGFAQTATTDPGVVINGVTWATRNVDAPGTFAETPESAGMFYQWNRKVGWSSTNPRINSNGVTTWDDTMPTGNSWAVENDPSPAGWRVPTYSEIRKLLNTDKVSSEWVAINPVIKGRLFTDKATGNSLFLPAMGERGFQDGSLYSKGTEGYYWSSDAPDGDNINFTAYRLIILNNDANLLNLNRQAGLSIRPVAANSSAIENIQADEWQISVVGNLLIFKNLTGLENIQIYDISGRNVESLNTTSLSNGTQTINISHLPAGVYIVKAGNHTKKIVKQ